VGTQCRGCDIGAGGVVGTTRLLLTVVGVLAHALVFGFLVAGVGVDG
jgi:hypothetical protein